MPVKVLKNFKGINEYVDFAELPPEYAQQCQNLDPDQTLGRLVRRKGYTKKYTDTFTNIISAYEAKMETSGEVILLLNDNGTFKYFKDGTLIGSLTTPSGSAVDTAFTNNYFAWKDSIRVTTGAGSTNHILWFGYTKRDTAENKGLFGNALDDNGTYRFLKAQLVPQGVFGQRMLNTVRIGDFYYLSFQNTKYIEKRDTSFRLIERLSLPYDVTANTDVFLATDGTYLYVAFNPPVSSTNVLKLNPNGFHVETATAVTSGTGEILGIAANASNVYTIKIDRIDKLSSTDLSAVANTSTLTNGNVIACNDTHIFVGEQNSGTTEPIITKRAVATIGTVATTSPDITSTSDDKIFNVVLDSTYVYVTVELAAGGLYENFVKKLLVSDLTLDSTYATSAAVYALVDMGTSNARVVSSGYGILLEPSDESIISPSLATITADLSSSSGTLDAGTYFYKFSLVDTDGQEFVLSDPVVVRNTGSKVNTVRVSVNEDDIAYFYRVKYVNVYRAFNGISQDEKIPATQYKLLKNIDINSNEWQYFSSYGVYYNLFNDDLAESAIDSTTYFESSGIGENVKPRYVNGKYMTWLDNKIHLANIYNDDTEYANHIVTSPVNQPDNVAFYNVYKYQEDGGDEIKGITNMYGRSVVFKEKRLGIFYNEIKEQEKFPGISSDKGYYKNNDDIFFLNKKGIYRLNGNTFERINDPVVVTYNSISDYTDGSIFFFDDRDRLIISFPGEEAFVYSLKYGTWTIYTNHSFKGYFKNDSGQYIGYSGTLFYLLFQTGDDDGTRITIKYESPLIELDGIPGINNEFYMIQRRLAIVADSGGTAPNMYIYRYATSGSGRQLMKTIAAADNNYSYPVNQTNYLQSVWGEAFSIYITGEVDKFEFDGMSLFYNVLGASSVIVDGAS